MQCTKTCMASEWLVHRILSFTLQAHAARRCIQNLNGLSIVFYCSNSAHTRPSDVYKTWMACPSYFIVQTPHTRGPPMYRKLEWLVHCILSFILRARATLRRKHALPTSVGLAQAHPNYWKYSLITHGAGFCAYSVNKNIAKDFPNN